MRVWPRRGSGKWQSSGGEKSKFGLAATQVLQLVEILREAGHLESLQLLHFHLGSQMANIRDIATGVRESARFYVELHKLGVNIQCFDVGGGLGVDYEGTRSQSDCSVNYGLNEYANNIILGDRRCLRREWPAAPDGDHRVRPRGDRAPYRAGFQHHRRGA
ncbi:arginine decarboxylase [Klebsiella pneumoniae]|uniref:Arginine decarboxylase n=1 Tax=Klebsiella pneumoniae TaxID=573 RepID=A0A2X1QIC3_KLEPN|nr:arginine decarboxylase [Klebsiella pneumoniae]